jgi:23S rRNA pseudouridine1911/1915/1917 synthase
MALRNETTIVVERSLPRERLDTYLRSRFPTVSRGSLQRLIEQGNVRVEGRKVKATHWPRAGQRIEIRWPEARAATAQPQEIPLEILFEDDDLVVINKQPDMVVHPSAGHEAGTLVNAVLHHCQGKLSGIGGVARPGIVHRLDKETSGCLVVAKNDPAHVALSAQFATRKVAKVYHAIVCGRLTPEEGEIHAAIAHGGDGWQRTRRLDQLPGSRPVMGSESGRSVAPYRTHTPDPCSLQTHRVPACR